jgi:penicillin-binding protein-related factor A (putative recombinase)
MIKSEAKFQTLFNHWLRKEFFPENQGGFAFELKHTRGKNSLPFSALEDHQLNSLLTVSYGSFIYKISDESQGYKPFDCFALRLCEAYVVICYPSFFVLIKIEAFVHQKKRSKAKSLSAEQAKEIADIIVKLKP